MKPTIATAEAFVGGPAGIDWHAGEALPTVPGGRSKALTLAVWLRDLAAAGELVSWEADAGRPAVRVHVGEVGVKPTLMVEVATDARTEPLRLSVPVGAVGGDDPHVVVLRYLGHRLELTVDGVLVDEEWPYGSVVSAGAKLSVAGASVARVAVWDRSLGAADVQRLGGGGPTLADREDRYLGPRVQVGQYWRPRGFDAHVGDCMPFFHGGRFHLFYLFDRHHHGSKWWRGAHQWAHASTTDLVHWDEHEMAVAITDEAEGSICTGSVYFHAGTYYAFYAVRTNDDSPAQLCASTSGDGVRFTKHPPLATLRLPYRPGPGRDPVVFRDPAGVFHMLVSTELADPPVPNRGGCLAELVSTDLQRWDQRGPFVVPGYPDVPECPDHFEWHGWYYLVFGNGAVARYRMSRGPMGPWSRPTVDAFDGPMWTVMKTAAFTGDRRLGAGFVPTVGYGGDLAFRELVQHADGTLGTKWPAEMVPATGDAVVLDVRPLTAGAMGAGNAVTLSAAHGYAAAGLGVGPRRFLLRARVRPSPGAACFGVRFRADATLQGGLELRFEPRRGKVGVRPADLRPSTEHEAMAIYTVGGLDAPFSFELLVTDRIVDVCVDGRRTLVASLDPGDGTALFCFAQDSEVTFEDLEVRPLA